MSDHKRNSQFSRSYTGFEKSSTNSSLNHSSNSSGGVKYFANLLDYGNSARDNDSVKNSMMTAKSVGSITSRRSSVSLSLATVPSLVIDVPKSNDILQGKGVAAAKNFATTIPIFTRDKYDLFGVGGKLKSILCRIHLIAFVD